MANCLNLLMLVLASTAKGGQTYRPHYHFLIYDADPRFTALFKARWQSFYGFDWKRVRAINRDGSPGFVKVSRYIAKYIAKPKNFIPWIGEGICEVPRRLSSRGFGVSSMDIDLLRKYYRAVGLTGEGRLERISERKKSISIYGTKFPLPRRLQELIYYDKTQVERYDYKKKKYVTDTVYKRDSLSRLVVAYERSRDTENFGKQLLYDSERNGQPVDWSLLEARFAADKADLDTRASLAEKNLSKSLNRIPDNYTLFN